MSATSNVTYLTAIELGRLLRSGQTTVVEVVSAALERVAASDPTLHA
jgi:Asp-tRNA(Asn)/Glu-tRNA(Gln) amidotransferase A subunit family amidase